MIGAGFMFVEIVLAAPRSSSAPGLRPLHRPLLADPVHGRGSYASQWVKLDLGRRLAVYGPVAAAVLASLWLGLTRLTAALGASRFWRGARWLCRSSPGGADHGQAFPAGMARFGSSPDAAPCCGPSTAPPA
jgi:hypothetical protein